MVSDLFAASSNDGLITIEQTSPIAAMGVFHQPPSADIPSNVAAAAQALSKDAPAGTPDVAGEVLVDKGRLQLRSVGREKRDFYVFPTANDEVCAVVTGLMSGCIKGFPVGEPITSEAGIGHFPPESGPPSEIGGLAKDGVDAVGVELDGKVHPALLDNNAWYFEFPDNHLSLADISEFVVTLDDGTILKIPNRTRLPGAARATAPPTG